MSEETPINRYSVTVMVEYVYDVEATSQEEAEKEGWNYEDYQMFGSVYSIDVDLEEEDIYGEEPEEDGESEDGEDE